jgi:hypothetical protein
MKKKLLIILPFAILFIITVIIATSMNQRKTAKNENVINAPSTSIARDIKQPNLQTLAIQAVKTIEDVESFSSYSDKIVSSNIFSVSLKSLLVKSLSDYKKTIEDSDLVQVFEVKNVEMIKNDGASYVFKVSGIENHKYLKFNQEFSDNQVFNVTINKNGDFFLVTQVSTATEPNENE